VTILSQVQTPKIQFWCAHWADKLQRLSQCLRFWSPTYHLLEFRRQYRAHRMTGSDAHFGTVIILHLPITRVPFPSFSEPRIYSSILYISSIITSRSPRAFVRIPILTWVNERDTFISTPFIVQGHARQYHGTARLQHGYSRLCTAVHVYARLCMSMHGCAGLCTVTHRICTGGTVMLVTAQSILMYGSVK
jgi:hypothetical protein